MPEEKEKLLEIGLNDLGRFAIGEETNSLYFDNIKVRDTSTPVGDDRLKREIREVVLDVVKVRFDNIESQLRQILNRLSLLPRVAAKMQMEKFVGSGSLRELDELTGQIEKLNRQLNLSKKTKRKQARRQPSPIK